MAKTHRSTYLAKRSTKGTRKSRGPRNSIHKFHKYIVVSFLSLLNKIKLYHWNTHSYATHKATDELYSKLNEHIDTFVEVLLGKSDGAGKNRAMILNIKSISVRSFNNNNELKREIEKYKSFLISFTNNSLMKKQYNADLIAIRDEILALLNQFLYLLTLH